MSSAIRSNSTPRYQGILKFWFGDPNTPETTYGQQQFHWWNSTPEIDSQIRDLFHLDYEKARCGDYEAWKDEPHSTLALILLFDQIPRNIFRGKPETYATDHLAIELAKMAREREYAKKLHTIYERKFLMMPFMHSENIEDQTVSLSLTKDYGDPCETSIAEQYYKIIQKFGRFPHRNTILGRESTPEELQFLSNQTNE